jgi:hypothetical protein
MPVISPQVTVEVLVKHLDLFTKRLLDSHPSPEVLANVYLHLMDRFQDLSLNGRFPDAPFDPSPQQKPDQQSQQSPQSQLPPKPSNLSNLPKPEQPKQKEVKNPLEVDLEYDSEDVEKVSEFKDNLIEELNKV